MKRSLDSINMTLMQYDKNIPYIFYKDDEECTSQLLFCEELTENQLDLFKIILDNIKPNKFMVEIPFLNYEISDFFNLGKITLIEEKINENKKTVVKFINVINISKIQRISLIEVNYNFYKKLKKIFYLKQE